MKSRFLGAFDASDQYGYEFVGFFEEIGQTVLGHNPTFDEQFQPVGAFFNLAQRIGNRLFIGWIIALVGGVAGLFLSYWWDLPSGAAIVCTFGALLIGVAGYALLRSRLRAN